MVAFMIFLRLLVGHQAHGDFARPKLER